MDINKMLAELRAERDQPDEAILGLAALGSRPWQTPGPSAELADGSETSRQATWE